MAIITADVRKTILRQGGKAAAAVAIAAVVVLLSGSHIQKQAERLAEHRQETGEIAAGFEALDLAKQQLNASQDVLAAVEEAFIPVERLEEYVAATEALAERMGMTQTRLDFGAVNISGTSTIAAVPVSIILVGNVNTLAEYISAFEELPYFSEITSFTINAPNQGWTSAESSIQISAQLHVVNP